MLFLFVILANVFVFCANKTKIICTRILYSRKVVIHSEYRLPMLTVAQPPEYSTLQGTYLQIKVEVPDIPIITTTYPSHGMNPLPVYLMLDFTCCSSGENVDTLGSSCNGRVQCHPEAEETAPCH